ncbi:hypothetical protein Taro_043701 [Colocasia esculenta]|uniref:Uncharacterized protein n=1 Tax=Colocasia esculenta TaxID=4460 RepID=A0A843WZD1_COLES|nr:hypothetical protein [Colocasia esculenta]
MPARPQFRIGTSTRSIQGCIRTFPVRRPNSSPGAWSRAADAIAYGHPFAQMGIAFHSVIRIAYKTPIWNQNSEAPVVPLLPQEHLPRLGESLAEPTHAVGLSRRLEVVFNSGRDLHPNSWKWVHEHRRYSHPLRTQLLVRLVIEIACKAPIQKRHFDPIGTRLHSEISGPAPKFLSESVVAGCRCERIRTPLRSNRHNIQLGYQNRLEDPNSESALRCPCCPPHCLRR